jgi:uncharacterized protein DUF397
MDSTSWRKSTFSGQQGNGSCVEVALGEVEAAVRDSKNTAGPRLVFPYGAWRAFITKRP